MTAGENVYLCMKVVVYDCLTPHWYLRCNTGYDITNTDEVLLIELILNNDVNFLLSNRRPQNTRMSYI